MQQARQRSQFDGYGDEDLNHTSEKLHMQIINSQRFLKFRTKAIRAIQHEFEGQKKKVMVRVSRSFRCDHVIRDAPDRPPIHTQPNIVFKSYTIVPQIIGSLFIQRIICIGFQK